MHHHALFRHEVDAVDGLAKAAEVSVCASVEVMQNQHQEGGQQQGTCSAGRPTRSVEEGGAQIHPRLMFKPFKPRR